jgi:hypothetical protein
MATTVCDFKSSLVNFSYDCVEKAASGVPAAEPPSFTPAYPKTQAAIITPASEVLNASIVKLVDAAYEIHAKATGATVSLQDGNLVGRKLFAVSIFPERSAARSAAASWQNIFAFVSLNVDLLLKPCHAFGLWFDDSKRVYVLDVVLCLSDRRTALELGRTFGQKSIYDLAACKEIKIKPRRIRRASVRAAAKNRPDFLEGLLLEEPRPRSTAATIR